MLMQHNVDMHSQPNNSENVKDFFFLCYGLLKIKMLLRQYNASISLFYLTAVHTLQI